ncbi:MAG: hypothetical protein ACJA02_000171 [Myxococcota bacterium]|jgi:hypothetical protein
MKNPLTTFELQIDEATAYINRPNPYQEFIEPKKVSFTHHVAELISSLEQDKIFQTIYKQNKFAPILAKIRNKKDLIIDEAILLLNPLIEFVNSNQNISEGILPEIFGIKQFDLADYSMTDEEKDSLMIQFHEYILRCPSLPIYFKIDPKFRVLNVLNNFKKENSSTEKTFYEHKESSIAVNLLRAAN